VDVGALAAPRSGITFAVRRTGVAPGGVRAAEHLGEFLCLPRGPASTPS
jgi:hypothetical protein